ncbi:Glycosyl hydrolase family 67 N-terminus [Lutibacter oricola]|uniref:Glycosyl hydrolase family 67 N-terminus n=1 Tax=Lutibacter oricola TaxID=762486 RepID=A0A1H2SIH8_9FLAO|nr:glycosyl hydrolase 115 family protein [Lutibacter oricola]SDW31441.1 Glycosyl hydrolase family 67 N-terminus [Lutibacter oricola]
MKKFSPIFQILFALITISCSSEKENSFTMFKSKTAATIYVANNEAPQILRAVNDLQNDIKMVTGVKPEIVHSLENSEGNVIIVGTSKNPDIQKLQNEGKLEEFKGSEKLSQSFLLKSVQNPTSTIKNALIIEGSDALGTVYGIYEISERIGVSPLYWWCDVTPKKQDKIVLDNVLTLPKEPSVKHRGIFINDEEALIQWSEKTTSDKHNTHISPEVYERVFELLLRLKANSIWPGMMQAGSYFFEAKDENGVPINPKNAKEYGIYVGSSHCENMARNNYAEWYNWAEEHKNMYDAKGVPVWDYTVNPKTIEAYWQQRLNESKDFNMIYTLGIRGVHDSPFEYANLKNPTLENKVKLLQKVIDRQREMIKETFGSEDAVTQIFVPYEETGELYNGESKDGKEHCEGLKLPEDVIMVWTEDNFGYARQLPRPHEQKRAGGNGLYYHLAYQGGATYDWLYTTPLPLIQEELRKVYDENVRDFWIVNVGDIKPAEMGLQFYMSLAYDIDSYPKNTTKDFIQKSAKQQFGVNDNDAKEVADLLTDFHNLYRPKKPEHLFPFWDWKYENNWRYRFYSMFDFGDETSRQVQTANELEQKAKKLYDKLDESAKNPFWHLVYYPVRSARLMLEKTQYYRKNVAYAKQGRYASLNAYKTLSEKAEEAIQADLEIYKTMENGKWNGIVDPYALYNFKERIFDVANIPNNLVYNESYLEEAVKGIGSVCEGQAIGNEKVELRFSSFEDNIRFIDVFNKEVEANNWTIESDVDWINFSKKSGSVSIEERLYVSINWDKTKTGENKATITVKDTHGFSKSYTVKATKYDLKLKEKSYIEGNNFIAIEAENYTSKQDGKEAKWEQFENFGYHGSSIFIKGGNKVEKEIESNSARLEYSVYFENTGTFFGQLYRIPTLNEGKGKTCEIAVGLDNEKPQILTGVRKKGQRMSKKLTGGSENWSWENNILSGMEKIPFEITVDKAGYHTIKIYQVNSGIGIDRLVICTDDQAKMTQKRGLIGAPESYNNITEYTPSKKTATPIISEDIAEIKSYPKPEALTKIKLNFALYSMIDALGYTPVNQRHIFNENKNQFGWRSQDVDNIWYHHNEASEHVIFWQRDGLTGKKEAKFYVRLKEGKYNIKYYMGDARVKAEMIYFKGATFDMSFAINGKTLMKNEKVVSGKQKIETIEVEIGNDELLELTLDGKWIINALEIKPVQ